MSPQPAPKKTSRRAADEDGRTRPKRREREVVDAAAKVFHERGYADASVQDVADELGILKGSLYYYIRTKEDLLFWLLEEVHEDVERILREVQSDENGDPLERIGLYVEKQVDYNLANLTRISVYYHDVHQLGPERSREILRRRRPHEDFITEMIRQAQRRGDVDADADARVLSNCVFAVIIWTYRWFKPRGRLRREDIAASCAEFALGGVLAGSRAPA